MNLRILCTGLLALTATLWMGAATASATIVTSATENYKPPQTVYTSTIAAAAEGHVTLDNPIAKIECATAFEGKVESHGEGVTAKGSVSSLSFTGCTESWHVTTVTAGSLEVHETGSGNGTITSSGATVEATRFGITCRYATSNTSIGTLTSSYATGGNATIDVNASIPFHSGSIFCGTAATSWTGSYSITTPDLLALQQKPAQLANLSVASANGGNFKENEEDEVSVFDENSPADYTLEKASVAVFSGQWGNEGSTCNNIAVKKGQAKKELCAVKVKCIKKGNIAIQLHVNVGGVKSIIPFLAKCA
jgi:hypothetical protein